MTINASKVKNLGNPRWQYASGDIKTQSSITETITSTPIVVCLVVLGTACDRYFIVVDSDTKVIEGSIIFDQDSTNSLGIAMTLTGLSISDNEITSIDWVSSDGAHMCQ